MKDVMPCQECRAIAGHDCDACSAFSHQQPSVAGTCRHDASKNIAHKQHATRQHRSSCDPTCDLSASADGHSSTHNAARRGCARDLRLLRGLRRKPGRLTVGSRLSSFRPPGLADTIHCSRSAGSHRKSVRQSSSDSVPRIAMTAHKKKH